MNTPQLRKLVRWLMSACLLSVTVLVQIGPTAPVARAASFVVSNLNNSGPGSLRQAILDANSQTGADTITFEISDGGDRTIRLESTLPIITDSAGLTIDDPGEGIIISGNNRMRVFWIEFRAALTLVNLTIADGRSTSYAEAGGIYNDGTLVIINSTFSNNRVGIYNGGDLTVAGSTFANNSGSSGGGIFNVGGTLTVTGSTFSDNSANNGGGIYTVGSRPVTLTDSTFNANSAGYQGGGLYLDLNIDGTATVANSTFTNNSAVHQGGGLYYGGLSGPLTVAGSTFSGNSAEYAGGGIYSGIDSTLTVTASTFSSNIASEGGGLYNEFSGSLMPTILTVNDSTFSENSASNNGGGIKNGSGSSMIVSNSTFIANSASNNGGGVYNSGRSIMTIMESNFSGNSALAGGGIRNHGTLSVMHNTFSENSAFDGGGIYNDFSAPWLTVTLTITHSTFSANSASNNGGGIYNDYSSTLPVSSSTFFANNAGNSGGGIYNYGVNTLAVIDSTFFANNANEGGGISNNLSSRLAVTACTFSANYADNNGSGIFNQYSSTATLTNTIMANSPSFRNCSGIIIDEGYNLENGTSCGFSAAKNSFPNTDPLLDPDGLKDNGGPTQTIALQPESPAINAIPNGANGCGTTITTDQRGVSRPKGPGCDIGAYELENQPPIVSAGGPYTVDEGASVIVTASGSDPENGPLTYAWDLDDNGDFEIQGESVTFSAALLDGPGSQTITVQVTDDGNLTATSQATIAVQNVAPVVDTGPDLTIIRGQLLTSTGSMGDSNFDTWYGTVDYGDSSGEQPLLLIGMTYNLSHVYAAAGSYTLTVTISDDDGGIGSGSLIVTVVGPLDLTEDLTEEVRELVSRGVLNQGQGNALIAKLEATIQQLERENDHAAIKQLQAFVNQVEAMISSGVLLAADGQPLIEAANEIIAILSG